MKCDEIFLRFTIKITKFLSIKGFKEITFFLILFRLVINKYGWEKIEVMPNSKL